MSKENGRAWDKNPSARFRLPYYGFDHVELCSGHAVAVHAPTPAGCASAVRRDVIARPAEGAATAMCLPQTGAPSLP